MKNFTHWFFILFISIRTIYHEKTTNPHTMHHSYPLLGLTLFFSINIRTSYRRATHCSYPYLRSISIYTHHQVNKSKE